MLSCLTLMFLVLLLFACNKQEEASSDSASSTSSTINSRGQKIYDNVCRSCHSTGVAGTPKLGVLCKFQVLPQVLFNDHYSSLVDDSEQFFIKTLYCKH